MKPTDSQRGTLNKRDCRMAEVFKNTTGDNPFVDLYTIAIPEAGVLTVEASSSEFRAVVRLYDARGRRLGGMETGSRLRAEVQAGPHKVYVTSEGIKTGTYALATSFTATPACAERRLTPGGEIHGDLSLGDCRHPISLKQRGLLIVQLQASEPGAGGQEPDAGGDTEIILREGREELQRDRNRIARELEGDYTIVVHPARARSGTYTLQTAICPGERELSLNVPIEATLTDACRAAMGDRPQNYSLKVASGTIVSVEWQGRGVEPLVSLSGTGIESLEGKPPLERALGAGTYSIAVKVPKEEASPYALMVRGLCPVTEIQPNSTVSGDFERGCNSATILNTGESVPAVVYDLRTDQNCEFSPAIEPEAVAKTALLDFTGKPAASPLLAGKEYLVMVKALAPGTQQFKLNARCRRVCVASELRLNEVRDGQISVDDCHVGDMLATDDMTLTQWYRLSLTRPATVSFELPGGDSGATLLLVNEAGKKELVEEGQTIRRALGNGAWLLAVKSPHPISYKLRASVPCAPLNLQTDQTAGTLSEADCYDGTGSYYRRYRILPDQTAVLELTATSGDFAPLLKLSDTTAVLAASSGAAGGQPAAIRSIVESGGDYAVQVSTESPAGAGAFDLARRLFPVRELEPNQPGPVAEFLDPDCLETTCIHYYRVHLKGDVTLHLSLKAPFAAILELLDSNWNLLEKAGTEISRREMKPDRYIVRVSTKSRTYGSYVLTASAGE